MLLFKYPETICEVVDGTKIGAVVDAVTFMIARIQDLENLERKIALYQDSFPIECIFLHSKEDIYRAGIKRFRTRHREPIKVDRFQSLVVRYQNFEWTMKLFDNASITSFVSENMKMCNK